MFFIDTASYASMNADDIPKIIGGVACLIGALFLVDGVNSYVDVSIQDNLISVGIGAVTLSIGGAIFKLTA